MEIKKVNRRYTVDGKQAVSVTTAISEGVPKPALINWAAKCVAQRVVDMDPEEFHGLKAMNQTSAMYELANTPNKMKNKAAVRGTAVHGYAERLVRGEQVDVPDEIVGHVEAAAKFMNEWKIKPLLVETVVGDASWIYAGTFDLVAELPDGQRILFDYKTSQSGIFAETAMQLAAYRWASHYRGTDGTAIPMSEVGITDCKAVHLRADGYDVYPLRSDTQVYGAFLTALKMTRARQTMGTWVGAAELPGVPA